MLTAKDLQAKLDELRESGFNDLTSVEAQLLAATIIADAVKDVAATIAKGANAATANAMLRR